MDPASIAALVGGGLSLGGSLFSSTQMPDYEEIAKMNLQFQEEENARQRNFSRELLARSKPNISAQNLYQLLYADGEQAYNKQSDRNLASVLATNSRQGNPSSATDIMARFNNDAASERADRAVSARLKAITGTLPGAAAIQSAAALFQNPAPQMQAYQPGINNGDRLAAIGYALPGLVRSVTSAAGSKTTNTNTGSFGNMGASFLG